MQSRMAETPRLTTKADTLLMGQERERREVVELLIREVRPNRQQPRTAFAQASLDELAESIRLHGVLEPIIVRAIPLTAYEGSGRQYELIAGERRWRAATLAGRATIPALVLPETTTDQATLELAITENLQREDLHPLDEASAFGRMQRELGYSYAQIAERLGKSKGYVQNRLRLLQLDAELQQLVTERPDTLTHVYELARVSDQAQRRTLIEAVRASTISLAETRARVQAILSPPPVPESAPGEPKSYLHKYDSDVLHEDTPPETAPGEPKSYLHKYDSDVLHEDTPPETAPGEPKSYLHKYDSDVLHEDTALGGSASTATSASLSQDERTALVAASAKVERYLADLALLSAADWAVLGPLAIRLSDLLRQVERAGDAARSVTTPDP
jgi:ParB family chromosome partitioning protein